MYYMRGYILYNMLHKHPFYFRDGNTSFRRRHVFLTSMGRYFALSLFLDEISHNNGNKRSAHSSFVGCSLREKVHFSE